MYLCKRYVVYGYVQDVGFRMFTLKAAKQLYLVGWVQNQATGSVEIIACGPEHSLKEFEAKIIAGPENANVDRLIQEEYPDPKLDDFIIKK
ncbi:acylphosphatase [Piscirickettsia salmonis]|uniref:acylphosphatase n=1 Tax=Piscirickettsia salmonis TaxID=1238 RepID=UPI000F08E34D|nr:acylphosphatase [Piscirickettsiaceae bacterium NZ-RLO2]